jgi:anaerobic selenocysteine-containing dehydrogenase
MSTHKTYCRICAACCGLQLVINNNRVLDIRGDPDHPITRGYSCIKGATAESFIMTKVGFFLRRSAVRMAILNLSPV